MNWSEKIDDKIGYKIQESSKRFNKIYIYIILKLELSVQIVEICEKYDTGYHIKNGIDDFWSKLENFDLLLLFVVFLPELINICFL